MLSQVKKNNNWLKDFFSSSFQSKQFEQNKQNLINLMCHYYGIQIKIYKNTMLKVIILITCLTTAFTYCPGSYTGSFLACTFNYEYSNQNCTQFLFDNCTWVQCVAYTIVNNVSVCTQYQTLSLTDWNQCTAECCISSKTYPQSYDSLEQCEADVKKRDILIITIVSSIIGGIAFIIILIVCIKNYRVKHPGALGSQCILNLLMCKCFVNRNRGNNQQIEINNTQNVQPYRQIPTNRVCVMCIQKGLIPYQTPFLQVSQKQPYICDSCKMSMKL